MNSLETPYLTNSGFDDLSMNETILTLDFPIPCNVSAYFANIIIQLYIFCSVNPGNSLKEMVITFN